MTADACVQQINAGAWVLGALDGSEADIYAAHVQHCVHCQGEIQALTMVHEALPLATEQIAPPRALEDRIMAVVTSEAQLLRATGPQADRPPRPARRSWFAALRPLPLATGALALIAAGVIVGASLSGGGAPAQQVHTAQVSVAGAHASLVVQGSRARLQMTGMSDPPVGKVYEVWVLRRNGTRAEPTDALFTVSSGGRSDVTIPAAVHHGDQVMVTAEPAGGSRSPTSAPVITAQA